MLALAVLLAGVVLAAHPQQALGSTGVLQLDTPDTAFVDAWTDDRGVDPGYEKDVASCFASVVSDDTVSVAITNAYPSYVCRVTVVIENTGASIVRRGLSAITAPEALEITSDDQSCGDLGPGQRDVETFEIQLAQSAEQTSSYPFSIAKRFVEAEPGTVGFWSAWDSHETFSPVAIEEWLEEIADTSAWLDSRTVEAMADLLDRARGPDATPHSRFLAHYLATRLNERSGLLCSSAAHDVADLDPGEYLELTNPETASLGEIIEAIESKAATATTKQLLDVMKTVCDEINNASR